MPPPFENVHVYEIDRATSRLELIKVNPTRGFGLVTERGSSFFYWQNGRWYDTGQNEITDLDQVPEQFRKEIETTPVTAGIESGPVVTKVCKFCGTQMNASELEQHYIQHVTDTMAQAGRLADTAPPPLDKGERSVKAKNTHTGRFSPDDE